MGSPNAAEEETWLYTARAEVNTNIPILILINAFFFWTICNPLWTFSWTSQGTGFYSFCKWNGRKEGGYMSLKKKHLFWYLSPLPTRLSITAPSLRWKIPNWLWLVLYYPACSMTQAQTCRANCIHMGFSGDPRLVHAREPSSSTLFKEVRAKADWRVAEGSCSPEWSNSKLKACC